MDLKLGSRVNKEDLETLNNIFKPLNPIERIDLLYQYFKLDAILLTSSFGTKSALLLYWMSNIENRQSVHFLDTGYHFEETLAYKEKLTTLFNLDVINIHPEKKQHRETLEASMWNTNSSKCCYLNKVIPLEQVKLKYEVWISGLMAYQTPFRKDLNVFEIKDNLLKFYPLIDFSEEEFKKAYHQANLPIHPLETLGYHSIGCLHCTKRGKGRSGRWGDSSKTECGLHFN